MKEMRISNPTSNYNCLRFVSKIFLKKVTNYFLMLVLAKDLLSSSLFEFIVMMTSTPRNSSSLLSTQSC